METEEAARGDRGGIQGLRVAVHVDDDIGCAIECRKQVIGRKCDGVDPKVTAA